MSLMTEIMARTISGSLTTDSLKGARGIRGYAFYKCNGLTSIEFPETLEFIGEFAFSGCTSLDGIDSTKLSPYCLIGLDAFADTKLLTSLVAGTMLYMADYKILIYNTINGTISIPNNVVQLAPRSCRRHNTSYSMTSFVIPDSVEIVGEDVFDGRTDITRLTVGASARILNTDLIPSASATTLIFRQPAGMEIELPTPGDGSGLGYTKDSRSVTIYTDNECIKNYNWSGDNATVTFYPLSQAPK